jgi:hypothetical protein
MRMQCSLHASLSQQCCEFDLTFPPETMSLTAVQAIIREKTNWPVPLCMWILDEHPASGIGQAERLEDKNAPK